MCPIVPESLEVMSSQLSMELQTGPGLLHPLLTSPIRPTSRIGSRNQPMSLERLTVSWQMVILYPLYIHIHANTLVESVPVVPRSDA
jgi:hypothetical protein